VSFAGDSFNNAASDQGGAAEKVTTIKASPTVTTTASITAGGVVGTATAIGRASCRGSVQETGDRVFTLTATDSTVGYTKTIATVGGGTWGRGASRAWTQVGSYSGPVSFAGDSFNNAASDQGGAAEKVTTIKASPTVTTTASITAGGVVGTAT